MYITSLADGLLPQWALWMRFMFFLVLRTPCRCSRCRFNVMLSLLGKGNHGANLPGLGFGHLRHMKKFIDCQLLFGDARNRCPKWPCWSGGNQPLRSLALCRIGFQTHGISHCHLKFREVKPKKKIQMLYLIQFWHRPLCMISLRWRTCIELSRTLMVMELWGCVHGTSIMRTCAAIFIQDFLSLKKIGGVGNKTWPLLGGIWSNQIRSSVFMWSSQTLTEVISNVKFTQTSSSRKVTGFIEWQLWQRCIEVYEPRHQLHLLLRVLCPDKLGELPLLRQRMFYRVAMPLISHALVLIPGPRSPSPWLQFLMFMRATHLRSLWWTHKAEQWPLVLEQWDQVQLGLRCLNVQHVEMMDLMIMTIKYLLNLLREMMRMKKTIWKMQRVAYTVETSAFWSTDMLPQIFTALPRVARICPFWAALLEQDGSHAALLGAFTMQPWLLLVSIQILRRSLFFRWSTISNLVQMNGWCSLMLKFTSIPYLEACWFLQLLVVGSSSCNLKFIVDSCCCWRDWWNIAKWKVIPVWYLKIMRYGMHRTDESIKWFMEPTSAFRSLHRGTLP